MHIDILTLFLILTNIFVTYKGLNDYGFFEKYKFNVGSIKRGEFYRLITGAFLHVGWGHLAANMITLYFFMPVVEGFIGVFGALVIYMVSLIGGNLLVYYFHRKHDWYSAVGNSGAVNGILFASILIKPGMTIIILPIPIPIPAIIYGIGYLLYTTYGMQRQGSGIGHEAHFGGAAAGMLATAIYYPAIVSAHPMLSLVLALLVAGGFFWTQSRKT